MVLKLYGAHFSPYVRLVAAVLLEKEVPFEFIAVDVSKGEHKTPEYLSKHPYGQIPCIVCFIYYSHWCQYTEHVMGLG